MDATALYDDLVKRELIKPEWALAAGDQDDVLEDDVTLAEIAGIAQKKAALTALIRNCIRPLVKEIIFDAHPAEVMVLRQSIVDLASVVDKAESYLAEYNKRKQDKENAAEGAHIGDNPGGTPGGTAEQSAL
jgi:phosphoenolpyruvate carboxylase